MMWKKPNRAWQWLLLLTPSVAAMLAAWAVATFAAPLYDEVGGRRLMNVGATIGRLGFATMITMAVFSAVLARLFSAGEKEIDRAENAGIIFLCLLVVNSAVAFGGCTAVAFASSLK